MSPMIPLVFGVIPIPCEGTFSIHNRQTARGRTKTNELCACIAVTYNYVRNIEHIRTYAQHANLRMDVLPLEQHWVPWANVQVHVFMEWPPIRNDHLGPALLHTFESNRFV